MHKSEQAFADFLTFQGKTYEFQPKRFELEDTTYRADFYCPEDDTYYEVVGTRQAISAIKWKILEFIRTYPDIKFRIVKPNGIDYFIYGIGKSKKKIGKPKKTIISSLEIYNCKYCTEECKLVPYAKVLCCPQFNLKEKLRTQ